MSKKWGAWGENAKAVVREYAVPCPHCGGRIILTAATVITVDVRGTHESVQNPTLNCGTCGYFAKSSNHTTRMEE